MIPASIKLMRYLLLVCVLFLGPQTLFADDNTPATVDDDPAWDDRFGPPGVDGGGWTTNLFVNPPSEFDNTRVLALATDANQVFVGGRFTSAGGKPANFIARWNSLTDEWSTLGAGLNESANAIAINGAAIYVGGNFTQANGVNALHVAQWNSTTGDWSALGSGLGDAAITGSRVNALAVVGGTLYAGGTFTQTGTTPVNYVARWDGAAWQPLGAGVNGAVESMVGDGSNLYLGGTFTTAGGISANRVARWDGSTWHALGSGVSGGDAMVDALAIQGNDLYIAGGFTNVGGVSANNVARWDGSTWQALGSGIETIFGVDALAVVSGMLYAGGTFQEAGGTAVHNIAQWNGTAWSTMGNGTVGNVGTLATSGDTLYAGGFFRYAGQTLANKVARWDGTAWHALGPGSQSGGPHNTLSSVAVAGDEVYLGGFFEDIGEDADPFQSMGSRFLGLGRWNNTSNTWLPMGQFGLSSRYWYVNTLVAQGDTVYIGGHFFRFDDDVTEDLDAYGIVQWNRTTNTWSSLGGGVGRPEVPGDNTPADVHAIAIAANGDLYAGGQFPYAGGAVVNHIARWDGTAWSGLNGGMTGGNRVIVNSIVMTGSQLYVGGEFTASGGVATNGLARWEGTAWSAIPGFAGVVQALALQGNDLLVGGAFTIDGWPGVQHIARWNGSSWHALGSGVSEPNDDAFSLVVYAIAVKDNHVFIGGNFVRAGNAIVNGIARWDGVTWHPLGSGVSGGGPSVGTYVADLAISGNSLWVGGNFTAAGGKPSAYFAHYDLSTELSQPTNSPVFLPIVYR